MTGPAYNKSDYAGFLRRTAALCIDGIILALFLGLTPQIVYQLAPEEWLTDQTYDAMMYLMFATLLAYVFGFRMLQYGTPGYRLVRIRYAYMLNGRPPATSIIYRSGMAVGLLMFFFLDHLWILVDPQKQAWHDKMSGFYVVKRGAEPTGIQRIRQRVINFWGLTLFVYEPVES